MWKISLYLLCVVAVTHGAPPASDGGIYEEIQNGHYKFALDLGKEISKVDSSKDYTLISPADIYAALSVALYPSGGQTEQQLLNALGLTSSNKDRNGLHTTLANLFLSAENNVHANLSIANGIFLQNNFQISDTFKQFAKNVYKCELATVDYMTKQQETLETINKWVSAKTNGRIPKICEEPYSTDTVMVLANALYFHSDWKNKFKTSKTSPVDFNTNGKITQIPLMSESNSIQYVEDAAKKYKAIGLDYENQEASAYYILPNEGVTLQSVANSLQSDDLIKIISASKSFVSYQIPKMKLEYESDLVHHLQSLGVKDMFEGKADFSRLAPNVHVSAVTHKVEIKFNEDGTTGSAATAIKFSLKSAKATPPPILFTVNRPFIFLLHHRASNLILFYGLVNKPTPFVDEVKLPGV